MAPTSTNFVIQISIIAAILFVTLQTVSGIMCFQCNSGRDAGCAELIDNSTDNSYYRACEQVVGEKKSYFCRTIVQTIKDRGNLVRVVRSCGWERHRRECYEYEDEDHQERVCQCFTDGCNSRASDILRPSILAILACLPVLASLHVY